MASYQGEPLFERIRFHGAPRANPQNIVQNGEARFTLLSPRLVRLEWSAVGVFEDRSTYAFPNRDAAPVEHIHRVEDGWLVVQTAHLMLRYQVGSGRFSAHNLSIAFDFQSERRTWHPRKSNLVNLRGTRRTLDVCDRDASLEEGLFSRSGWTLFDDSLSVVFNDHDGWVAPRPEHDLQDWYFFAFGDDFKGGLLEYTRFGGKVPLIPRFILGAWWSRYWAYSDQDLKDLVLDFEKHNLPLDVLVVDMDWHTPHSWTGYTWNRELFPDPAGFLQWVHDKGLRATFNLHPAEGVQHFEDVYPQFAEAMGLDPTSLAPASFRITDKKFVKNYFELLHHPMEEQGVDFWWMDWQQGEQTEMKGLDALPWLNHLHFLDSTRRGQRGMLYSRWGGLGNHRYPIGFSGDTVVGWRALQFQPYFTATASNVAYGWWSHDIGGHMGGATEPELYARWVQFGALSPCLRLHATKDERCERRPWAYPPEVFRAAQAAFHLRYQLVPYLYTMARQACDTSLPVCRPMYYEYPHHPAAYTARYQYFFGDGMIAAPLVFPADPDTGLAAIDAWVPPGDWIDFETLETYTGPRWIRLLGDLQRVPRLVRAGSLIPLAPAFDPQPAPRLSAGTTDGLPNDRLVLAVFPGPAGSFRLYEDDGSTFDYLSGEYEWTGFTSRIDENGLWEVNIGPVEGHCPELPGERAYEIRLYGSRAPVKVWVGEAESPAWEYDPARLLTTIHVPLHAKRSPLRIAAFAENGMPALGEERNRQLAGEDARRILGPGDTGPGEDHLDSFLEHARRGDFPGKADLVARLGGPFVSVIEFSTPEECAQQLGRVIVGAPAGEGERYDLWVEYRLQRAGEAAQRQVIDLPGTEAGHILETPFHFDGKLVGQRWEAQITLNWRGITLHHLHQSDRLVPTIPSYQVLYYDPHQGSIEIDEVLGEHTPLNPNLGWQALIQDPAHMINLNQPYGVWFYPENRAALDAGGSAAAYLAARIHSPSARTVELYFQAGGELEFYLNGQKITSLPVEAPPEGLPFTPHPFRRAVQKLTGLNLRAGENILVVHTRPLPASPRAWYFGGVLLAPDGVWMDDILYQQW